MEAINRIREREGKVVACFPDVCKAFIYIMSTILFTYVAHCLNNKYTHKRWRWCGAGQGSPPPLYIIGKGIYPRVRFILDIDKIF